MTIIKPGKLPTERDHEGTCRYCGAQVRFKEKEGRLVPDGYNETSLVVDCPTSKCGHVIHGRRIRVPDDPQC